MKPDVHILLVVAFLTGAIVGVVMASSDDQYSGVGATTIDPVKQYSVPATSPDTVRGQLSASGFKWPVSSVTGLSR